jgi:peptidoglycan-associated lipoprotein
MKDTNMKLTKFTKLLVLGLVLTVAASGCKKKPTGVTPLPGARAGAVPDMGPGGAFKPGPAVPVEGGGLTGTELTGHASNPADLHAGWPEDRTILKSDTVYFDFDSSVLKASEKPKVAAVASYLKANSANAVKIEGNCDERGTEEYNRSLGERRALAVREELIRIGIEQTRVDTISFGKDKPEDPGHDESAWRKNRRDDFIVLSPPGK